MFPFSYLPNWLRVAPSLLGGHFPGLNRPGREFGPSPPFSAEVKNEWRYTTSPPICLHVVEWDNFTFYWF